MSLTKIPVRADRTPNWRHIAAMLRESVGSIDLMKLSAGGDLGDLSSGTIVEGFTIDPESAMRVGSKYVVPGAVFVELNYGGSTDGVSSQDMFPISVEFTFSDDEIVIGDIKVDTSSFYG